MGKSGAISKPLLAVLILLFVALLAAGYLQYGTLQKVTALAETEELQLSQARLRLQSMKALAEREEEFKEALVVLEQLLPGTAGDERLLVDMQSAADLSALRFTVIRFGERVGSEGYYTIPLNFSFEGRFHGLLNLLEYIRVYERAVRLEEIRIALGQEAPDVNVQIRASAFYTGK